MLSTQGKRNKLSAFRIIARIPMHDYHDGGFGEETLSSEYCSSLQYARSSRLRPNAFDSFPQTCSATPIGVSLSTRPDSLGRPSLGKVDRQLFQMVQSPLFSNKYSQLETPQIERRQHSLHASLNGAAQLTVVLLLVVRRAPVQFRRFWVDERSRVIRRLRVLKGLDDCLNV